MLQLFVEPCLCACNACNVWTTTCCLHFATRFHQTIERAANNWKSVLNVYELADTSKHIHNIQVFDASRARPLMLGRSFCFVRCFVFGTLRLPNAMAAALSIFHLLFANYNYYLPHARERKCVYAFHRNRPAQQCGVK